MGIEAFVMKQQGQRHPLPRHCLSPVSSSRPWGDKRGASERRRQHLGEPRKPCCRGGSRQMPAPGACVSWGQHPFLFTLCCSPPPASLSAHARMQLQNQPPAEVFPMPSSQVCLGEAATGEGDLPLRRHGDGSSARAPTTFTHPTLCSASWQQPSYANPFLKKKKSFQEKHFLK